MGTRFNEANDMSGSSAFPLLLASKTPVGGQGMSLRDYFAAKAVQSLILNPHIINDALTPKTARLVSENSYMVADVMLKERLKQR